MKQIKIPAVFMRGEQKEYGGAVSLLKSAALESVLAILQAPIRMLAHSLFVLIALTGWGQPEDRKRSNEAGFDHHLVKPVELDALQALTVRFESLLNFAESS